MTNILLLKIKEIFTGFTKSLSSCTKIFLMKKPFFKNRNSRLIVFLSLLIAFNSSLNSQSDTLHLYFKGQQTKAADTTEAKIAAWARTLNGKKVNVVIVAYYDISDFKTLATERKDEMYLSVMRKARDVVNIEKTEIKKGSKSQRFTVDIIYQSPESIAMKEKEAAETKAKEKELAKEKEKEKEKQKEKEAEKAKENAGCCG